MASETAAAATARRPTDWTKLTLGAFIALFALMFAQIGITVMLMGWLRSDINRIEQTVKDTRAELRAEIANTRTDLRAEIAAVGERVTALGERVTAVEGRMGRLEQRMARQEGLISGIVSVADIPLPLADTDTDAAAGD